VTKHSTMTKALKVIGITRHIFLKWEEILALSLPRERENRVFPDETIQNLTALRELLDSLEIGLGEWISWREILALNQPNDAQGCPDFSDPYWAKYYRKLHRDLTAATVDVHELSRWEWELQTQYPRDAQGNISLTRDWCRYLQTVQEKYAAGKDTYWMIYNLQTPAQRGPAQAVGVTPEY
jgi:hypothetical protein